MMTSCLHKKWNYQKQEQQRRVGQGPLFPSNGAPKWGCRYPSSPALPGWNQPSCDGESTSSFYHAPCTAQSCFSLPLPSIKSALLCWAWLEVLAVESPPRLKACYGILTGRPHFLASLFILCLSFHEHDSVSCLIAISLSSTRQTFNVKSKAQRQLICQQLGFPALVFSKCDCYEAHTHYQVYVENNLSSVKAAYQDC